MKVVINIGLSLLSGTLLALSWPYTGDQTYLLFIALIPLLILEDRLNTSSRSSFKVFVLAYLAFFVFNYWTTWWIELASPGGMWLAEIFNSLFMAVVFLLFHWTRRLINDKVGYWSLPIYWLAFEYLHTNWELSWIWLNLGNAFANDIHWIQWYEFTGTGGGTLWVLAINVMAFSLWQSWKAKSFKGLQHIIKPAFLALIIGLPFLVSILLFNAHEESGEAIEVVVLQPNIDPYNDKFSGMSEQEQIDQLLSLANGKVTDNTELVLGPETAFPNGYWEHDLENSYGLIKVREFLEIHQKPRFIVGLSSIRHYKEGMPLSETARPLQNNAGYYDYYNSVMQIAYDRSPDIYRKSKLVLGVEKMPFTGKIPFLEDLAINLGGATGSLGTEGRPVVFNSTSSAGQRISVIPAICYESIYGEYLTEFVREGANLIGVVTNDGWWGNTPGYWQHLSYSRLRAIELRRSVARSANTGISAFINQRGEILQQTDWWVADAMTGSLSLNDEITFYAAHGDFIGRTASFLAVFLLIWAVVKKLRRKGEIAGLN